MNEENDGRRRIFIWICLLGLIGYNLYLQDKGIKTLIAIYEWRLDNLELVFKEQSKDINDCMAELPEEKSKEIYRKHREELAKKIEEYFKAHPDG